MIQDCDTCGDSYINTVKSRIQLQEKALQLSVENKEPYAICKEGEKTYFLASLTSAFANGFIIDEVIH